MTKIALIVILLIGLTAMVIYLKHKKVNSPSEQDETIALIRENAENAISIIKREEGLDISFDADSVVIVEDYIDRHRTNLSPEDRKHFAIIFGSFLGETVIAVHGGSWIEHEDQGWGIKTTGDITAFPFVKVSKLLDNGLEDSISSFLRAIPAIADHSEDKKGKDDTDQSAVADR